MIFGPVPSSPSVSRIPCSTAFTLAAVPTGINTGVSTTPCGNASLPRRPPLSAVSNTSNCKPISSFYVSYWRRLLSRFAEICKSEFTRLTYTYRQLPMPDRSDNPATEPNPMLSEPELVAPFEGQTLVPHPPRGRRAAATFIFLTVSLDMLALGMIAPVLPRLIEGFMHGNTANAAQMLGLFGTTFAVMQFFCSPILGSLSDRFGRRPIVLLSNFGLGFDYLLMAWAPALHWLFLGRVISGITSSSIPTAMAYMADVTPRERRAAAFGLLSAAFGLGFVLGPAVGGILGNVNPRLPFWVAGC